MKNQIKYSEIYSEVLKELGDDLTTSICYVPKKIIVRMWEKMPKNNYGWSLTDDDIEIVYDL